jgi:RNA polymerase primary sigma factor
MVTACNLTKPKRATKSVAKREENSTTTKAKNKAEINEDALLLDYIPSDEFCHLSESQVFKNIPELEIKSEKVRAKTVAALADLPNYMRQMCATKLLTPEQELLLFRRMNYAKYRIACLKKRSGKYKVSSRHVSKLASLQASALQDRNTIVSANIRLVISIAKKYNTPENTFDDLLSEGIASLMYAVEKFNYSKGFRFSTYATYAIQRSLFRYMEHRSLENNRFVAAETDMLDSQPQLETAGLMTEGRWHTLQHALANLLAKLEPRERTIIRLRFGLGSNPDVMTLQSLAEEMGVCKERVRQIEQRAISKLRAWAESLELPTMETAN